VPTLLLTGANRGLGLAFAARYLEDGWRVHACCRHPERAHRLRALGGDLHLHRLELRNPSHYQELADALGEEPLDLVLAAAGIGGPSGELDALDVAGWLEAFHVNTIAPVQLAATLRRHLARAPAPKLVALTSMLASIADNRTGGLYAYRTSKAALNMAWRSLAIELAAEGIVCTLIHPGWVRTDMGGPAAPLTPEESVRAMQRLIARLGPADSGRFLSWRGEPCPW